VHYDHTFGRSRKRVKRALARGHNPPNAYIHQGYEGRPSPPLRKKTRHARPKSEKSLNTTRGPVRSCGVRGWKGEGPCRGRIPPPRVPKKKKK